MKMDANVDRRNTVHQDHEKEIFRMFPSSGQRSRSQKFKAIPAPRITEESSVNIHDDDELGEIYE